MTVKNINHHLRLVYFKPPFCNQNWFLVNLQNTVPVYVEESKPAPAPPAGTPNLFNPPEDKDIRTIYVPFENAVNVPDNFDINVASSFGYTSPSASQDYKFPNFPDSSSPSYDNPISSYDAPIYNDNYNAKVRFNLT